MTACPDEDQLARVIDGAADAGTRASVLAHVDECASCLRALAGAAAGDETAAPAIGDRLGRFELVAVLGIGAMGIVYEARDTELDRTVALKLVRSDRDLDDERLREEARSLARVSSPHVVAVHDIGVADGQVFIAMERIAGVTLRAWLEAEPRDVRAIVDAFEQAGRGLAAAHEAGVIHRDVKPDNIFVGDDGRVRIGDFGLARHRASEGEPLADNARPLATRSIAGTPAYMAPEQRTGGAVTMLSDQYGFCVALGEALTGARPETAALARTRAVPERRRVPP